MQDEKKDAALALVKALEFELRDWNGKDLFHFPEINAVHVFNAAEFIKSLLAEVERLTDSRTATADFTMQVVADRQRMREALKPFTWISLEGQNIPDGYPDPRVWQDDLRRARDAYSLNPASKEATSHEAD